MVWEGSPMRLVWLLLLIPFAAVAWVPFYNHATPALFGFPFFYWYQLLWVPLTSLLTYLVYRTLARDSRDDG
jgi:membrane protein implicated in regulation of membrane protease activity